MAGEAAMPKFQSNDACAKKVPCALKLKLFPCIHSGAGIKIPGTGTGFTVTETAALLSQPKLLVITVYVWVIMLLDVVNLTVGLEIVELLRPIVGYHK